RVDRAFSRVRSVRIGRRWLTQMGAAVLAATSLLVLWWPHGHGPGDEPPAREPLAVVSADDVEIVSLHAADRVTLIVGVPPVTEPLVLVSAGDVALEGVEPDTD